MDDEGDEEFITVCSCDGYMVRLPNAMVADSGLLHSMLETYGVENFRDLQDVLPLSHASCSRMSLECIARCYTSGGRPLAMRWAGAGERQEIVDMLRALCCLDIPTLVTAACDDLGAVLAACPNAERVAHVFGPPPPQGGLSQEQERERKSWEAEAPALGVRGEAFGDAAMNPESCFWGLSSDAICAALRYADSLVREDLGIRELLPPTKSLEIVEEGRERGGSSSSYAGVSDDDEDELAIQSALQVVAHRWPRYHGSVDLIRALADLTCRMGPTGEAAIFALQRIATKGDPVAIKALSVAIRTQQYRDREKANDLILLAQQNEDSDEISKAVAESSASMSAQVVGADGCCPNQVAAVEALAVVARKGDQVAIKAVASMVRHADGEVRHAALQSLATLAEPLDPVAVKAFVLGLGDDNWRSRLVAISGLEIVVAETNQCVIQSIAEHLEAGSSEVRQTACDALERIAGPGSEVGIEEVILRLSHKQGEVRCTAIAALTRLVANGLPKAVNAVVALLEDKDSNVRNEAIQALPRLAPSAQARTEAVASIARLARRTSPQTRRIVLDALTCIANKGDPQAVGIAVAGLSDPSRGVRQAATDAVSALARKGDAVVLQSLISFLKKRIANGDVDERLVGAIESIAGKDDQVALEAIGEVVTSGRCSAEGKQRALSAVASMVSLQGPHPWFRKHAVKIAICAAKDVDWNVRKAAAVALRAVSSCGDQDSKATALLLLNDEEEEVRDAALEALETVVAQGDREVTDALTSGLEAGRFSNKTQALRALQRVSETGYQDAIESILPRLKPGHWPVRMSAVDALAGIAKKGDQQVLNVLEPMLMDKNEEICQAVLHAFGQIAMPGDLEVIRLVAHALSEYQNWVVREAAVETLRLIVPHGDLQATEQLLKLLSDRDPDVRTSILDLLGEVGSGEEAIEVVEECSNKDIDDAVRREAKMTLIKLHERCAPQAEKTENSQEAEKTTKGLEVVSSAKDDREDTISVQTTAPQNTACGFGFNPAPRAAEVQSACSPTIETKGIPEESQGRRESLLMSVD